MSNETIEAPRIQWPDFQTWLFVAMELSWITAFLLLLDAGVGRNIGPAFALIGLFYPLALLFDGALQRQRPEQWQWIAGHAAAFALSLFVAFVMLAPRVPPSGATRPFAPTGWSRMPRGGTS